MLITESMKTTNLAQMQQSENNAAATTALSSGGTTNLPTTSNAANSAGTPLRSRNHNKIDKQLADEKLDKSENANFKGKNPPKPPDEFYKDLQQFHEKRGTPIRNIPRITGVEVDLHRLYCKVTERGGFLKVNSRDEWEDVLPELGWSNKVVNGSAGLKFIYRRFLEKYERVHYFGEDIDKIDSMEAAEMAEILGSGRSGRGSSRYPTSIFTGGAPTAMQSNVAMTYNYKQHHINMDRRRQHKLSTDLHKASPYEKLMLSLLSPLPNEQDFAINACTLMANESKHTLKINEYPKLLDALLAHTGVFSDYTMRKLFQHVYNGVRHHSLYGFWYDLLHERPEILDLYTDETSLREAALIDDWDDGKPGIEEGIWYDSKELDFLNLGRGQGTQDYVGQRVLQVIAILRNLSFFEENLDVLIKNKTFLRFLVMSSNVRWSNVHIQALEIMGNVAAALEILDPTTDDFSRCLMTTICDGIDGSDRAVIINCLEILYKLCQKEANEDSVLKCLTSKFYETISLFLSLNDIMLLLFTLEAIYGITCLGSKSCQSLMQVRGIVDQLISLITVEAQSYGPDGCILMRVVETVPGNMLPIVAQNIANLQNVAVMQKVPPQTKPQVFSNPSTGPLMADLVDSMPAPFMQAVVPAPAPTALEQNTMLQQQNLQIPQNSPHEDEQYALAWLGATFERTLNSECHVEQQELYRMYLSHCQKAGKQSVVNHMHFPKLVRLIFTQAVGPAIVRKVDGTDLPGYHYVSIRLRAQPLPMQKNTVVATGPSSPVGKQPESPTAASARKNKRKPKTETAVTTDITPSAAVENINTDVEAAKPPTVGADSSCIAQESLQTMPPNTKCEEKMDIEEPQETIKIEEPPKLVNELGVSLDATQTAGIPPQSTQTSLIKSLLANKVNQRQQKQKDQTVNPNNAATPNASAVGQPIKVASNVAISSLVNNPLMQNTSVKVGQTTIKPLNSQASLEKKLVTESTPPPLAPLSGANVAKDSSGRTILLANQMLVDILDKKMTEPPAPLSSGVIQKRKLDEHQQQNKRLAMDSSTSIPAKEETPVTPSKNAANLYAEMAASILEDEDLEDFSAQTQPTNTANSITNEQPTMQQPSLIIPAKMQTNQSVPALQNVQRQLVFQTNQGPQLKLTQTSGGGCNTAQQMPNAMATIKTDQGLQTVPVILHQKPMDAGQHHANQQQLLQQVMQPQAQQTQTQYVLATNQQGQTYLVAQQSQAPAVQQQPAPTQTVLVTQTPQQQSTGAKTIIILQQNPVQGQQTSQQIITTTQAGQPQKMIMTTPQGQQVLVTQRPPTPQQIFINPQTGAATHIQHMPAAQNRQILQNTNTAMVNQQQHHHQQQHYQQQQQQTHPGQLQAGQMSPSLLNQLNQIPATIKLHQPAVPQQQSRLNINKAVPGSAPTTASPAPVAVPQLQQHQSIIQQHIISGPSSEKRHVILGGGRAIEIKETVITQTQAPPQQCQLNAQTIITTQQPTTLATTSTSSSPILQQAQQQVQQQIRAVLEQHHPSIIQQKISSFSIMPPQQQPPQHQHQQMPQQSHIVAPTAVVSGTSATSAMTSQAPALIAAKLPDPIPSLLPPKNTTQTQNVLQTTLPSVIAGPSSLINTKKSLITGGPPSLIKPSLPTVKLPTNVNAGPPPLAAVNSSTTNSPFICNSTTQMQCNNGEKDSSRTTSLITPVENTSPNMMATSNISPHVTTSSSNTNIAGMLPTIPTIASNQPTPITQTQILPPQQPVAPQLTAAEAQWLYICDWRNCPRKQFKSLNDLQHHVCTLHAPDHLDQSAEIFCQWGVGPGLCDGIPRKRFSLMTHLIDRHLTVDSLRAAVQRRLATGMHNIAPAKPPVTIVRNIELSQRANAGSPAPSTSTASSSSSQANAPGYTALNAIKRRNADFMNSKELLDENEGPVTKSIRLTAALILRNLVIYTTTAKRSLRRHEPHLANIALSNVESSGTVSHILYELNN